MPNLRVAKLHHICKDSGRRVFITAPVPGSIRMQADAGRQLWCPAQVDIVGALTHSAWKLMYLPGNATNKAAYKEVIRFKSLNATYIKNWKAASTTLWDFLPLLLHHERRSSFTKGTLPEWMPETPQTRSSSSFAFSFMREPIAAALSGYAEMYVQYAQRSRHVPRPRFMQVPCTNGSLMRFQTYLTQLEQGEAHTWYGGYHVFPQVLKLASSAFERYDFLGKVENLTGGLRALVAALHGSLPWLEAVLNGTQPYPHNNQSFRVLHSTIASIGTCERISVADLDRPSMCRLCCLYAMDYMCMGPSIYAAPRECITCHDWRRERAREMAV